jgi:8-oxo-dGTP diphosphatase
MVVVHLLLVRKGAVPFLLRTDTGTQDGTWGLIAGRVDPDESVRQAMVREAKEEAGLALDPERLRLIHVSNRRLPPNDPDRRPRLGFYFRYEDETLEPVNREPEKHGELRYFSLDSPPSPLMDYLPSVLESIKRNEPYSELGYDE